MASPLLIPPGEASRITASPMAASAEGAASAAAPASASASASAASAASSAAEAAAASVGDLGGAGGGWARGVAPLPPPAAMLAWLELGIGVGRG